MPRNDPLPRFGFDGVAPLLPIEAALAKLPPVVRLVLSSVVNRTIRKRGSGDAAGEPCPVEPNRPLNLSGGVAAALEFDGQ